MSIPDEELELLIGKLVDGEISPSEKERLDGELACNEGARVLLEQMQVVNRSCREHIASRIRLRPGEARETFHRAWRQHDWSVGTWFVRLREAGHLRFVTGLAAGLVLGFVLHLMLVQSSASSGTSPTEMVNPGAVAGVFHTPTDGVMVPVAPDPLPVARNVDWYTFTDDAGNQWLVEGIREDMIQPVAYHGELR